MNNPNFNFHWSEKFSEQTCEISYKSQTWVACDERWKNACMKTGRRIKIQRPTATENNVERKEVTIVSIQGWPIERPRASCVAVARRKRTRRGVGGRGRKRGISWAKELRWPSVNISRRSESILVHDAHAWRIKRDILSSFRERSCPETPSSIVRRSLISTTSSARFRNN